MELQKFFSRSERKAESECQMQTNANEFLEPLTFKVEANPTWWPEMWWTRSTQSKKSTKTKVGIAFLVMLVVNLSAGKVDPLLQVPFRGNVAGGRCISHYGQTNGKDLRYVKWRDFDNSSSCVTSTTNVFQSTFRRRFHFCSTLPPPYVFLFHFSFKVDMT